MAPGMNDTRPARPDPATLTTTTTTRRRNEARRLALQQRLVAGLHDRRAYSHPVGTVEQIDTHLSTLLLAGDYVYKLKKPLAPGFLDFRSRAARRHFCEEELRLNRRSAPDLYLDVVPVLGSCARPRFGTPGEAGHVLDWAVRMRRFDSDLLFDALARRGTLGETQIDRLAQVLADFHTRAEVAPAPAGDAAQVLHWARANLLELQVLPALQPLGARLQALLDWTEARHATLAPLLAARQQAGRVRVCHGDLHLGNIVWLDGAPRLFDALEFNAELREIDVISDLAFPFMDLLDHGLPALAWRLLNGWFEASGDYAGAALLGWFAAYRALVRAKVAALQAGLPGVSGAARDELLAAAEHRIGLAEQLAGLRGNGAAGPMLVLCWGLSGSGKSTVALQIAMALGALRLRSDVERKRLFDMAPDMRPRGDETVAALSPTPLPSGARGEMPAAAPVHAAAVALPTSAQLYDADATRRTYARLGELAAALLGTGIPVVIDAASLKRAERMDFHALAARAGAGYAQLECIAPDAVLRARIEARQAEGRDASDATLAVLALQQAVREPPAADASDEVADDALHVDTVQRINATQHVDTAQQLDTDRPRAELARACADWVAQWLDRQQARGAAQLRGQSTHMRSGCLVRPATSSMPSPQPQK